MPTERGVWGDRMGRNSLLKSTKKTPAELVKNIVEEAKRKEAILQTIQDMPGSIKANLDKIGLAQSTYYRWSKKYKSEGLDGLETGGTVSDKVWKKFSKLQHHKEQPTKKDRKLKAEEKQAMKSDKDSEKVKELLFKKFDAQGVKDSGASPEASPASGATGGDPGSAAGYTPPPGEPMDKTMKYAVVGFAAVLVILLMSSFANTTNFYFEKSKHGVELWQGLFAPMGEKKVAEISGTEIARKLGEQETYSKKEAFSILFEYLMNKADDVLNESRTPDLKAVQSYLRAASKYAVTSANRKAVQARLNSIDFLVISGKADLALNKGTMEGFETAKAHLTEAIPYATTDIQKEIITKRLAAIEYAMASNKISKGEKQLAQLYREALDRHLRRAKQYSPDKSEEIDAEIAKITKWLTEFDKRHVGGLR